MANQHIFAVHSEDSVCLTYHLVQGVNDPSSYTKVMELARLLDDHDTFEIVISGNPGGYLSGARALTTVMDATEARTVVVAIDELASAATMVAINADELVMTPGSSMMIHTASYGVYGSAQNVKIGVDFNDKSVRETISYYYRPFLNKKELKRVLGGKEVWLSAEECTEKFEKVLAKRKKAADKEAFKLLKLQREALQGQLEALDEIIEENS